MVVLFLTASLIVVVVVAVLLSLLLLAESFLDGSGGLLGLANFLSGKLSP